MSKNNYSNEEKKRIMEMSPDEWQEYKVAHKEYEQMSDLYTELSLKLEAEKEKYLDEGKQYDQDIADHFKEKNLAEYEKLQNEIIEEEKKEYLKRLENQKIKNIKKPSIFKKISINHILIALIVIVLIIVIYDIIKYDFSDSYFSDDEIARIEQEYNKDSAGALDEASGKFFASNETDENKAQDMALEAESKAKLYYEGNEIGLLCYSRNINISMFTQKQNNDGLIELEPKENTYYTVYLNNNTNKYNRTINNVVIDYDNLKYLNNNDVYLQYEDLIINRNTSYDDVKNFFASRTDKIIETKDDKMHLDITVDRYRILIDSYQNANVKPVGTVDKLTIFVNP